MMVRNFGFNDLTFFILFSIFNEYFLAFLNGIFMNYIYIYIYSYTFDSQKQLLNFV